MQNVENDMDDLFRRAAENYPLKKSKGDWESVLKKISVSDEQDLTLKKQTKNDSKKILIIFLLAVILILSALLIFNANPKVNPSGKIASTEKLERNVSNSGLPKERLAVNKLTSKVINVRSKAKEINPGNNKSSLQQISFSSNSKVNNLLVYQDENNVNENRIEKDNHSILKQSVFDYFKNSLPLSTQLIGKQPAIYMDSNTISSLEKKKLIIKVKPERENGLYVGINAGPDFSKVKSGNFKSPGFSAGIVLGYRINRKIFAETGFSIGSKYYSSDGQLFNEEGASMPDGMVIMDLQGYSRILEIPLKIGYNIYKKNKESFFISTGVSAYIMTMEKNNYDVMMNGNPGKMVGLYQKNNVKTPAAFNLSLGWEHQLRPLVKLRIEPYLKLPLQGIGVGKLPVTSTGIQIGIYRVIK
ncbi:MAG: hypothetical protein ABI359_15490 [Ginsengibacter sp.]